MVLQGTGHLVYSLVYYHFVLFRGICDSAEIKIAIYQDPIVNSNVYLFIEVPNHVFKIIKHIVVRNYNSYFDALFIVDKKVFFRIIFNSVISLTVNVFIQVIVNILSVHVIIIVLTFEVTVALEINITVVLQLNLAKVVTSTVPNFKLEVLYYPEASIHGYFNAVIVNYFINGTRVKKHFLLKN